MKMSSATSSAAAPAPTEPEAGRSAWSFTPLALPEVVLISAPRFGDVRGWFSETYNARVFAEHGIESAFVQDNMSYSAAVGTVRGLHYQSPPFAQAKLVRVLRGRILDVAVDIRHGSPAYGRHVAVELSAEDGRQLYVPVGFAHGFVTREPDTVVAYKVSSFYAPDHDHGIFWADPELGIAWGLEPAEATVSDKDARQPAFSQLNSQFTF